MSYDFILKSGRIIDPSCNIDMTGDIAVKDKCIAAIKKTINQPGTLTYPVDNLLVCPGLIDFHTHACWGDGWGINPDQIGPKTCVTTFVDFGTCGAGNISGFIEHIIKKSELNIFSFLNISINGLSGAIYDSEFSVFVGELEDKRMAIPQRAIMAGIEFPDTIRGIKVRCSYDAAGLNAMDVLLVAEQVARSLKKPLAVHIGKPPATIQEILSVLKKGDIVTHAFRGAPNSLVDSKGNIIPEAIKARKRGVLFDVGHGSSSFSFSAAGKLVNQGFWPDMISSDLHTFSIVGPAYDLPTTMTKFLGLGLSVYQIIERVTSLPAQAINITDKAGTLAIGSPADIAVLGLENVTCDYADSFGETLCLNQRFRPKMTIKNGRIIWNEIIA